METYISYLRKKVDREGEPLIQTVRGFGYSLRRRLRLRSASLRARLLVITLAMVAVGLALAGWAVNRSLHSFLVDRVDQDLIELEPGRRWGS